MFNSVNIRYIFYYIGLFYKKISMYFCFFENKPFEFLIIVIAGPINCSILASSKWFFELLIKLSKNHD